MAVAIVGMHDAGPAVPHQAREAQRLGQQKGEVVAQTGAIQEPRARRRLERDAAVPKHVRHLAFGPVQQHQRLIAPAIELLDQLRRGQMAAADEAADERKSDHDGLARWSAHATRAPDRGAIVHGAGSTGTLSGRVVRIIRPACSHPGPASFGACSPQPLRNAESAGSVSGSPTPSGSIGPGPGRSLRAGLVRLARRR
jgi:hypothetical protein